MSSTGTSASSEPSAVTRREAAVWIARLHSPDRTPSIEAGLRRWLDESSEHRQAFERANELWEAASRLPEAALPRIMRRKRATPATSLPRAAIGFGVLAVLVLAVAIFNHFRDPALVTEIGEQRIVTLRDGTRVSLNTATRVVMLYDEHVRRIRLESGEARFDVTKRPEWPFVVLAGGREITALGTSFVVRRDRHQVAVTLMEGKVVVRSAATVNEPLPGVEASANGPTPAVLTPGERLTFRRDAPPTLDRPTLEKVTAWQRGLVALDYTRLSDAVEEMNRYSSVELVVEGTQAENARISGVFRAGDSLDFARAVARTHQLRVLEEPERIVITGAPEMHKGAP